jgi:hypothetical protein
MSKPKHDEARDFDVADARTLARSIVEGASRPYTDRRDSAFLSATKHLIAQHPNEPAFVLDVVTLDILQKKFELWSTFWGAGR